MLLAMKKRRYWRTNNQLEFPQKYLSLKDKAHGRTEQAECSLGMALTASEKPIRRLACPQDNDGKRQKPWSAPDSVRTERARSEPNHLLGRRQLCSLG
jgi:hypothetical protein